MPVDLVLSNLSQALGRFSCISATFGRRFVALRLVTKSLSYYPLRQKASRVLSRHFLQVFQQDKVTKHLNLRAVHSPVSDSFLEQVF